MTRVVTISENLSARNLSLIEKSEAVRLLSNRSGTRR